MANPFVQSFQEAFTPPPKDLFSGVGNKRPAQKKPTVFVDDHNVDAQIKKVRGGAEYKRALDDAHGLIDEIHAVMKRFAKTGVYTMEDAAVFEKEAAAWDRVQKTASVASKNAYDDGAGTPVLSYFSGEIRDALEFAAKARQNVALAKKSAKPSTASGMKESADPEEAEEEKNDEDDAKKEAHEYDPKGPAGGTLVSLDDLQAHVVGNTVGLYDGKGVVARVRVSKDGTGWAFSGLEATGAAKFKNRAIQDQALEMMKKAWFASHGKRESWEDQQIQALRVQPAHEGDVRHALAQIKEGRTDIRLVGAAEVYRAPLLALREAAPVREAREAGEPSEEWAASWILRRTQAFQKNADTDAAGAARLLKGLRAEAEDVADISAATFNKVRDKLVSAGKLKWSSGGDFTFVPNPVTKAAFGHVADLKKDKREAPDYEKMIQMDEKGAKATCKDCGKKWSKPVSSAVASRIAVARKALKDDGWQIDHPSQTVTCPTCQKK